MRGFRLRWKTLVVLTRENHDVATTDCRTAGFSQVRGLGNTSVCQSCASPDCIAGVLVGASSMRSKCDLLATFA